MIWLLTGLIALPLVVFGYYKAHGDAKKWCRTGVAFGLVADPVSIGIYGLSGIPVLGPVVGVIGLLASLFHNAPGYWALVNLGFLQSNEIVSSAQNIFVMMANGLFWSVIYGIGGDFIDNSGKERGRKAK